MAKAKSTASPKQKRRPVKLDDIGLDLYHATRRVEAVECMAECLQHALLERRSKQNRDLDRVLAVCTERYIADELRSIRDALASILVALKQGPYVPMLESPILGLRTQRLMDEVAREGH